MKVRLVLFSIVAITSQCLHAQPLQQGIGQKGGRNAPASLHFSCVGAGRPIVILEAGGGWGAADWAKVQPGIGNLTQVCSYDRDPDRCCDEVIDDLRSLYARRPFPVHNVLVGHSLGGLYVRRLAARFPDAAGLVLVDSADEKQLTGMIVPGLKPELIGPVRCPIQRSPSSASRNLRDRQSTRTGRGIARYPLRARSTPQRSSPGCSGRSIEPSPTAEATRFTCEWMNPVLPAGHHIAVTRTGVVWDDGQACIADRR
ncbi:MAG: hypothetical protein DMG57_31620 [Acidobacteria bacterium]|nr:MAG: hypothetical protein DMG57_31620 [Acidobacteriota bacterium]